MTDTHESFDRMFPVFAYLRQFQPRIIAEIETARDNAIEFRRAFVEPNALAIERRVTADPTYVAWDVLREAAKRHYFTMTMPRILGGRGAPLGALIVATEEIAAGCLGLANLIGVNGLALATIAASGDLVHIEKVSRWLVAGERAGRPELLATAITEPGAGTDVEDVELLRTARLCCEAKPVSGGYCLNGRKVFISNGNLARAVVVIAPTDRGNPVETMAAFLVERGAPGFSVGRVERKMGQKACPAVELVFEDCFLPAASRLGSGPMAGPTAGLVLGATRGPVGAFGAAVARGAYERALEYAHTHKLGGRWLVDHQWVQIKLADMRRNVMLARSAYVEAMLSNEMFGLSSLFRGGALSEITRRIPGRWLELLPVRRLVTSKRAQQATRQALDQLSERQVDISSAFGAAAKVTGTDLGVENTHLALDILGADGLRHDRGVEKLYRDAKLLQIYEGTNQLNRIDIYKRAVMRDRGAA